VTGVQTCALPIYPKTPKLIYHWSNVQSKDDAEAALLITLFISAHESALVFPLDLHTVAHVGLHFPLLEDDVLAVKVKLFLDLALGPGGFTRLD